MTRVLPGTRLFYCQLWSFGLIAFRSLQAKELAGGAGGEPKDKRTNKDGGKE